jgi:hypothetical protein
VVDGKVPERMRPKRNRRGTDPQRKRENGAPDTNHHKSFETLGKRMFDYTDNVRRRRADWNGNTGLPWAACTRKTRG